MNVFGKSGGNHQNWEKDLTIFWEIAYTTALGTIKIPGVFLGVIVHT